MHKWKDEHLKYRVLVPSKEENAVHFKKWLHNYMQQAAADPEGYLQAADQSVERDSESDDGLDPLAPS